MKPVNHYRIVDRMGTFYPEQEYIGFRSRRKWKVMSEYFHSMHGSGWIPQSFDNRKDAEKYLAARIAEDRLNEELRGRGPVVVREVP